LARSRILLKITRGLKNIYFDTSALADDEVIEKPGWRKLKRF
jgi:hypothetical protein